jgi:tagatose-6-phosphate ketose/aldose isomerase
MNDSSAIYRPTSAPGEGSPGTEPRLLGLLSDRLEHDGGLATAEEIVQQPALWRLLPTLLQVHQPQLEALVGPILSRPDLRIVLTGAGTSAFIGKVVASALSRQGSHRVDAVATTDLVSNPDDHLSEDLPTLLVSFARSGDSPESAAATELADSYLTECRHLVLTCNADGALARQHARSDRSLVVTMPAAANDTGFAMTSSFTCMTLSALLLLAPELVPADVVEVLAGNAEQTLSAAAEMATHLTERGFERVVYLGSGPLKGIAQESALKMLELTAGRVASWHESPLGFRHGPKSAIDDRTLVVLYVSADPYTRQYDLDMLAELRESMDPSSVVAIGGPDEDENLDAGRTFAELDDAVRSVVLVLPSQVLALHHSLAHSLTPDNPFPSGAVNRVVQGVIIHPHR